MLARVNQVTRQLGINNTNTTKRLFGTGAISNMAGKITDWVAPDDKTGEFKRGQSQFRNFVKKGGQFPPEADRYHLYVSYACPWAHRTLIVRSLKGLESIIPYTSVHWHLGEKGWRFATPQDDDAPGAEVTPDPVSGHEKYTHLRDLYFESDPDYKGRFTVPVLYDKKQKQIVSNESAEIIRMLYTEFDDLLDDKYKNVDLFPKDLQKQIDEANEWTYNDINNGVYKSGFATSSSAYEKAVTTLFSSLDRTEKHFAEVHARGDNYYFGKHVTEADVRLFTTIVRFDPVYVQHFKCNLKDIRSGYPHIHQWLRHLYWNYEAFKDTTEFTHIKRHYTRSHSQINPFGITPLGPVPDILKEEVEVAVVGFAASKSA